MLQIPVRFKLACILAASGHNEEILYPDISTKEKAQLFVGLDIPKLNSEKKQFLKTIIPEWLKIAKEREASY